MEQQKPTSGGSNFSKSLKLLCCCNSPDLKKVWDVFASILCLYTPLSQTFVLLCIKCLTSTFVFFFFLMFLHLLFISSRFFLPIFSPHCSLLISVIVTSLLPSLFDRLSLSHFLVLPFLVFILLTVSFHFCFSPPPAGV